MRFLRDLSPSAFAAGFVAVLVGFTSSVALVFQAAQAFHATPEQITSWVWALGLGRSEEHTSELQSQSNLVCRLLLEKKKKNIKENNQLKIAMTSVSSERLHHV